jgi:hypothetical protein
VFTKNISKVQGGLLLWCSSGFGSSPDGGGSTSSPTKRARPRRSEMVRRQQLDAGTRFQVLEKEWGG